MRRARRPRSAYDYLSVGSSLSRRYPELPPPSYGGGIRSAETGVWRASTYARIPRDIRNRGRIIMPMTNRLYAEFLGTAWLVLGGCGSAVLAAAYPQLGIGFAGVALAFGITVVTMAYAVA